MSTRPSTRREHPAHRTERVGLLLRGLAWVFFVTAFVAGTDADAGPEAVAGSETSSVSESEAVRPDDELDALLGREIATGRIGSFGFRLAEYGVNPYVHAYATVDLLAVQGAPVTFDLHYFNVFVGASIADRVHPEIQLEYEHGGDDIEIRFAQVDVVAFEDWVAIRAGKFLVPFGVYNEYLYPEFIAKTAERPLALTEIVPVSWAEVGVQARGRYAWAENREVSYAIYVANGLEQRDDPDTAAVDSGGPIRAMRGNNRDKTSGDKAFGGRLGVQPHPGLTFGVSAYNGAYTADAVHRLSMFGVDAGLRVEGLTVQSEVVYALQGSAEGDIERWGGYVLGAIRLGDVLEPLVMGEIMRLGQAETLDRARLTLGVNLVPYPVEVPSMVVHASYGYTVNEGLDADDDRFIVELAVGF